MTQNQQKTNGRSVQDRIERELADSFDEELELEMEIDDDRLAKLLAQTADYPEREELDRRVYFKELFRLQGELVKLQDWVLHEKHKVVVIFEGRDAAGKGGVIKRITQRLNPRVCRVAALPAPNERERTKWYFQRYVAHLPAGGEIVLFDRSWYNRAGVEQVMGFCTESDVEEFFRSVPEFERMLVRSGITLIKYWFSITRRRGGSSKRSTRKERASTASIIYCSGMCVCSNITSLAFVYCSQRARDSTSIGLSFHCLSGS
jgi:polyphosphate kinase 2